jgi:hypothetical protein
MRSHTTDPQQPISSDHERRVPFHQPTIQEKFSNLTEVLDYIVLIVVI